MCQISNKTQIEKIKWNCAGCVPANFLCDEEFDGHLDASNCVKLKEFDCNVSNLKSLDLSNCTNLVTLDCLYNELTAINLTGCTSLTSINLYNNFLSSIDITGLNNIVFFDCSFNCLTLESIGGILKQLVDSNVKNGTLVLDGDENAKIENFYLEYVSLLKLCGWKIIYNS